MRPHVQPHDAPRLVQLLLPHSHSIRPWHHSQQDRTTTRGSHEAPSTRWGAAGLGEPHRDVLEHALDGAYLLHLLAVVLELLLLSVVVVLEHIVVVPRLL